MKNRTMTNAEIQERESYIVELIKESGTDGLIATEIDKDLNLTKNARSVLMHRLTSKYTEIKRLGKLNEMPVYVWKAKSEPEKPAEPVNETEKPAEPAKPKRETHSPFLKNRYEKTNKNNEGYPDMTAKSAISNVNGTANKDWINPDPGEIWVTEESSGKNSYFFVLSSDSGVVQGVKLYDIKETINPETIARSIRVKLGAVTYVGDCARITYKLKKYFVRRARGFQPDEIGKVRKEVADALGIIFFRTEKVEVPVEKIVEKVVEKEVPVEKIVYRDKEEIPVPEGYISKAEAEIQDLKHQLEIWRSAFWAIAKRDRASDVAKNS